MRSRHCRPNLLLLFCIDLSIPIIKEKEEDAKMDENSYRNERANDDDANGERDEDRSKRQKNQGCVGEQLVCPITLELPFHPVTAEDGRIYERSAIEQHFRSNEHNPPIRSPMTNESIGTHLLPSPQTKELIEMLIENGSITGDLKRAWDKKKAAHKKRNDILKRAEDGNDAEAMFKVACAYGRLTPGDSEYGLERDASRSWELMVAAYKKNYPPAMAFVGSAQIVGFFCDRECAVDQNTTEGGMHLGLAAGLGSKAAQFSLGLAYFNGSFGFPRNPEKAVEWIQTGLQEGDVVYDDYPHESALHSIRQALEEARRQLRSS